MLQENCQLYLAWFKRLMMKYISGLYFKKKTSSKAKLFIMNQVKMFPLVFL